MVSDLVLAAAARGAEAAQIDGDGKAEEESTKGIEPIVIEGDVLAEGPRQQAEYKRQVGELQQTAVFRIEAAIQGVHGRFSFSSSVVEATPQEMASIVLRVAVVIDCAFGEDTDELEDDQNVDRGSQPRAYTAAQIV
jgi:hypothetical protein